ncbi:MAG: cytochrome c-type biogenesis CcmF C-terminal domain-containing protein, partial [Candidatus Zixiibacteriota bacterium]
GGYWAYETLGWGGYWAWDPVENTSLIPWMLNLALMHGLLIERNKGVFRRSNMVLAIFSFLLVVYGTFLTRSGILADFSVHSFTDLGISGYLVFFMLFFLTLSVVLLVVRSKTAKTGAGIKDPYSVDFAIAVGIFFLTLLSILTLIGTSAPLITRIFGEAANVSMDFYNKTALPMAVILALLAGISPFLVSKDRSWPTLFKRLTPALALSLISTVVAMVFGVTQVMYLLMILMASFALFGNFFVIFLQPGKVGLRIGGFVTHMGFGIMMVGIVISSAFSQTETVNLYNGQGAVKSFEYAISYSGMEGDVMNKDNAVHLQVQDGHSEFHADPKMFIAKENQGMMRKPFIRKYFLHDLYLSPQQQQNVGDGDKMVLTKGEVKRIGEFDVKFLNFDMGNHSDPNTMQVGAIMEVTKNGQTQTVTPKVAFTQSGKQFIKADMPEGQGLVMLQDIQADAGAVSLQFAGVPGMDVIDLLVLEVSKKPLINLVWVGLIMVVLGTFVSFIRRRKLQFAAVQNYSIPEATPSRSLSGLTE